ncbi:MAG TPA: DUF1800 family protein, partial [Pirellula sp.]|nr:DUF1800 family protein [Pirellula sp.]
PAMLVWLDADANRKAHPNENLSREIMELFTLGAGVYKESDVKEVARALTGWSVHNREFRLASEVHDDGEKTIFSQRGTWDGDDLLRLLVSHPSTPNRLAFRICQQFMGEGTTTTKLIEAVATHLRHYDLNIGLAVEALLRSEAFFAPENRNNRVQGPVEWSVGIARALEILDPPPSTLPLAEWTGRLGQDLFGPPNVFGWPGGRSWLTSRTMIGRANFVAAVVEGQMHIPTHRFDAKALAEKYGFSTHKQQHSFFVQLITGDAQPPSGNASTGELNEFVVSLLTAPETQIG